MIIVVGNMWQAGRQVGMAESLHVIHKQEERENWVWSKVLNLSAYLQEHTSSKKATPPKPS